MTSQPRILAFAGSTRQDSFNKKLIRIAAAGARTAGAEVTEIDLRDYPMPIFDGDLESAEGLPDTALALKQVMLEHDGLLIAAPEYNSSVTAVLKNTIDWLSRPTSDSPMLAAFQGKTVALMSAGGALGGLRGLVHVRAILGNIGMLVLPNQVTIRSAAEAFEADGTLKDAAHQKNVEQLGVELAKVMIKLKD